MTNSIYRYRLFGAQKFENYLWSIIICIGSLGFIFTGISSFYSFSFLQNQIVVFWPQGFIMFFYGLIGLIFSLYLLLNIWWKIGSGFNEFNAITEKIHLFRWGFPGKSRQIHLYFQFQEIMGIRLEVKSGFLTRQNIYLQIRGNKEIPLIYSSNFLTYAQLEKQASYLAKFLNVSLNI
uniref:Photosystem I assembly protein Ycf4 n=1 Tax=Pedobesia claviformis TaxID=2364088 RepID=A0A386B0S5_9CHLO|nr:photosystem I assembly protein Ycf4 [Pedobesia claviformis]AYC65302.1 photosystem I assembly protein Ycf4 [Pedobesia claviformis]